MARLAINPSAGGNSDYYGTFSFLNNLVGGNVAEGLYVTQATSPAMSVLVQPGVGVIREGSNPGQVAYHVINDTSAGESASVSTANASNPRNDYVVGYIDKSVTPSGTNNTNVYKYVVVAGTPSATPADPTVSQIQTAIGASNPYDIYARVRVGTGVTTITNAAIDDLRSMAYMLDNGANAATVRKEEFADYIASGCVVTQTSGLGYSISAGVLYISGRRLTYPGSTGSVSASKDTYFAFQDPGVSTTVATLVNTGSYVVANGASSPTLSASSLWAAKVISGSSAITSIIQYGNDSNGVVLGKRSPIAVSGWAANTTATGGITATTTLVTLTLANAPAGSYSIHGRFACEPNGGGNCSMNVTTSGTTGSLAFLPNAGSGVHASDADWNTGKYAHRAFFNRLQGHPGGTFTVNLVFTPETAVQFNFNQSGDPRWGTYLAVQRD